MSKGNTIRNQEHIGQSDSSRPAGFGASFVFSGFSFYIYNNEVPALFPRPSIYLFIDILESPPPLRILFTYFFVSIDVIPIRLYLCTSVIKDSGTLLNESENIDVPPLFESPSSSYIRTPQHNSTAIREEEKTTMVSKGRHT